MNRTKPRDADFGLGKNSGQQGSFLLELAFILPLLLMLFLGAFGLNQYISERHAVEFTVREAAKAALHKCQGIPDLTPSHRKEYVRNCLNNIAGELFESGRNRFGDFDLVLSYYDRKGGTIDAPTSRLLVSRHFHTAYPESSPHKSKFSEKKVDDELQAALEAQQFLIIAEAYAPSKRNINIAQLFIHFEEVLYAVAIT